MKLVLKINRKDNTLLLFMSEIVLFCSHTIPIKWSIWVAVEMMIGCVIFLRIDNNFKKLFFRWSVFTSLLAFISNYIVGNTIFYNQLYTVIFFLPVALCILEGHYSVKRILRSSMAFGVIILILALVKGYDNVFYDVSHNFFATFLMILLVPIVMKLDVIVKEKALRYNLLLLSLLFFLISIVTIGRGGIICLGVFALANVVSYFMAHQGTRAWVKALIIVLSISCVAYFCVHPDALSFVFSRFYERKDISRSDEPRMIMIMEYLNNCTDLKHILFGGNLEMCKLISIYNNNPHNSFIFTHAHFGIVMLIVIVKRIINVIIDAIKSRNILMAAFVVSLIIRMFTDSVSGAGPFDIAVICVFYYYLRERRSERWDC